MDKARRSLFAVEQRNGFNKIEAAALIRTDETAAACYREFCYQTFSPHAWQVEVNGELLTYDHRELRGYTQSGLLIDLRRISGMGREKPRDDFQLLVGDMRTGVMELAHIDWVNSEPDGDGARLNMIASLKSGSGQLYPRAFEFSTHECVTYTEHDASPEAVGYLLELHYELERARMAQ